MRTVLFDEHGDPAKVLRCLPELRREPGPGQIEVALEASPIHPSDLDQIATRTGSRRPPGSAVPGTEGVGRIVAAGPGVTLRPGARVLLPLGSGTWRDRLVLSAQRVRVAPDHLDPLQLSVATLAPMTARLLLTLQPTVAGEWVVQNAGNCTVGRLLVRLARERGLRTVSLVRNATAERAVRDAGGDVALVSHAEVAADVRAYTGGASIRLALDAVGGPDTDRLAGCLSAGGTLVHYGTLSGRPCQLASTHLISREIAVRGFWWASWYRHTTAQEQATVLDDLLDRVGREELHQPIAATYPLDRIGEAVQHARTAGGTGRVVLTGEAYEG